MTNVLTKEKLQSVQLSSDIITDVNLSDYVTQTQMNNRFDQHFKPFWADVIEITDISVYNTDGETFNRLMGKENVRCFKLNDKGTTICGLDSSDDKSVTVKGILRSTDNGKSFTTVAGMENIPVQTLECGNGMWIVGQDASTSAPGSIWVSTNDGISFENYTDKILKDESFKITKKDGTVLDKNILWTKGGKLITNANWGFNTVKFINGKLFIAVASYNGCDEYGGGFILQTEDMQNFIISDYAMRDKEQGGIYWQCKMVWDLCGNEDGSIILAGTYCGLHISKDGGKTFNPVNTDDSAINLGNFKGVAFANNKFVAVSNFWNNSKYENSGIFYSDENGDNWTWVGDIKNDKDQIMNKFYAVAYGDGVWFAVASGSGSYVGGICYSKDGVNWKYLFPGKFKVCFLYDGYWYAYDLTTSANKLVLLQNVRYGSDFNKIPTTITSIEDLVDIVAKMAKHIGWDQIKIQI